ncbi:MAG TPA: VOC family protein [Gaiellaceae bacterium]|jgi:catechol 2,3-dioxygenase-like lactoylglutathione lyase family enzyme
MRLQHVSVAIADDGADTARTFYGGLLGLREKPVPPKLDPGNLVWFETGGDLELHLMQTGDEPPPDAHFCLAVDSGLDELRARLEAAGVETRTPTEIVGRPRFMCRDPFGNLLELTELRAGAADA